MDNLTIRLEQEVHKGAAAKTAWDSFICDYCETRRAQLLEEFCTANISDSARINTIKLGIAAIDGLEVHMKEYMDTGKMATKQLNKE